MWKQLFELFRTLLFLTRDVQENKEQISRLRRELDELNDVVERLATDLRSVSEREQHEREKLALQFENALLHFERQLPSARKPRKRN